MRWIPVSFENKDWISFLFVAILALLAFIKTYHVFRFKEFLNLLVNNKYIIIFNKKERSGVLFTFLLLLVQGGILSVAIWLLLEFFAIKISFYNIPQQYLVMLGVGLFIFLKFIFQRFVSYVFDFDTFSRSYLFIRLSYSNYAAFVLVFLLFLNIYATGNNIYLLAFSLVIFLYIQILGVISFAKLYKNEIKQYWYYFILYLCTFEIAPYVFVNYLIISQ